MRRLEDERFRAGRGAKGMKYTSEQFQRLLADHGITCSMSWAGHVWNNLATESFFCSLTTEPKARMICWTRA